MDVKDTLEALSGESVKYYPNTGNAGDSLINAGFYNVCNKMGLKYEVIYAHDISEITEQDIVIIGGGGAMVPEWPSTPVFISEIQKKCKKIIVLPQSIRNQDSLIRGFRENDIVFCRERYSYQYCVSLKPACEIRIGDDMAFYADVVSLLNDEYREGRIRRLNNYIRDLILIYHHFIRSKVDKKINAFRCDKEAKANISVKRRKINDFSSICRFSSGSEAASSYSASRFLKLIDLYEEVHTDRLHVVIAAVMLGKKVVAYPNSYYKVEGVVDYSLRNYKRLRLVKNED